MKLSFFLYSQPVDNFHFWSAVICFVCFLVWVFLAKKMDEDAKLLALSRPYLKFGGFYIFSSFVFVLVTGQINSFPLGSLLAGIFFYLSFYYIYFVGSLFLVRRSISIRLLNEIENFKPENECTEEKLLKKVFHDEQFHKKIEEKDLRRMIDLGLLKEKGSEYSLTENGRGAVFVAKFFFKLLQIQRD